MSVGRGPGSGVGGPRGPHGRRGDDTGPVLLGEVLDQLMNWLKKPPADVLVTVFKRWDEVVGPDVAQHCRPVAVDANRLVVKADDPMWADELRWNSDVVLDRLAELSGAHRLEGLTVRVGPHTPAGDDGDS